MLIVQQNFQLKLKQVVVRYLHVKWKFWLSFYFVKFIFVLASLLIWTIWILLTGLRFPILLT
jgi:hypothetical protein